MRQMVFISFSSCISSIICGKIWTHILYINYLILKHRFIVWIMFQSNNYGLLEDSKVRVALSDLKYLENKIIA